MWKTQGKESMFDSWDLGEGICSSDHSCNGYRYCKNSVIFQERSQNWDEVGCRREAIDSLDCAAPSTGKTGK